MGVGGLGGWGVRGKATHLSVCTSKIRFEIQFHFVSWHKTHGDQDEPRFARRGEKKFRDVSLMFEVGVASFFSYHSFFLSLDLSCVDYLT